MKVSKIFTFAMAAAALAFTSCGQKLVLVESISIPETLEVSNVEAKEIVANVTPADAKTTLVWTSSDESIAIVLSSGQKSAVVTCVGTGEVTITASADGVTSNECVVTCNYIPTQPVVEPVAGKTIIVAKLPSITCGAILTGVAGMWSPEYNEGEQFMFTRIDEFDGWWQAEFDNSIIDAENPDHKKFKIFCTLADGTNPLGWSTGWQNAVLLEGDFNMPENGKDDATFEMADAAAGYVFYLEVGSWEATPCVPIQPAGSATFVFTPCEEQTIPSDATVIFTGNFETNGWGDSDRVMTHNDGKWSWTGDVPQGFIMKVIVNGNWMEDPNAAWDGSDPFNFSNCIQDWE